MKTTLLGLLAILSIVVPAYATDNSASGAGSSSQQLDLFATATETPINRAPAQPSQELIEFWHAAETGNVQAMQKLLAVHSLDINAENAQEKTALDLAAENSHKDAVEYLLDEGADVHLEGGTLFRKALSRGNITMINAISAHTTFDAGDEIAELTLDQIKSLMTLVTLQQDRLSAQAQKNLERITYYALGTDNFKRLRSLLSHSGNLNMQNMFGHTPLFSRINSLDLVDNAARSEVAIGMLLAYGAHPNIPNPEGITPLMTACAKLSSSKTVMDLIQKGAVINAQTSSRISSATYDDLFSWHADLDPDWLDDHDNIVAGITALMIAANVGDTAYVKMLLVSDADPSVATENGLTAVDATDNGEVIRMLTDGLTQEERTATLEQITTLKKQILDAQAKDAFRTKKSEVTAMHSYLRHREQGSRNSRGLTQRHALRIQQAQEAELKRTSEQAAMQAGALLRQGFEGQAGSGSSLTTAQAQSHGTKRKREDDSDHEGDARGAKSARTGKEAKDDTHDGDNE